jgi:hypothetical protein
MKARKLYMYIKLDIAVLFNFYKSLHHKNSHFFENSSGIWPKPNSILKKPNYNLNKPCEAVSKNSGGGHIC